MLDFAIIESESDARALLLESYSEYYPVPLAIQESVDSPPRVMFELAYFL